MGFAITGRILSIRPKLMLKPSGTLYGPLRLYFCWGTASSTDVCAALDVQNRFDVLRGSAVFAEAKHTWLMQKLEPFRRGRAHLGNVEA